MAPIRSTALVIFALCVATPLGITFRNPDHIERKLDGHDGTDSRPGTPEIFGLTAKPKDWHEEFGDRLIAAASAHDAMEACDSFYSFGDYTWCEKAMPEKTTYDEHSNKNYKGRQYKLKDSSLSVEKSTGQFLGISYGIQVRDPWSELMSNMYLVDTKLYDCYFNGKDGPMAKDLHSEKMCEQKMCYNSKYEANSVCLGAEQKTNKDHDGRELKYDKLSAALQDRAPLSTFVKMDVEGSEWAALEQLLASPEDLAKIRTLDMEVHLHQEREGKDPQAKETVEKKVEIMERLAKEFAVTGSTIEPLYANLKEKKSKGRGLFALFAKKGKGKEPTQERLDHPKNGVVYATNGMPLDQYCISFVNRKLL